MRNTIVREIFIAILLGVVIIVTLRMVLFDFIPSRKTLPQSIKYQADSVVRKTLKEINSEQEKSDTINNDFSTETLLKSYTIEQSDLKNYVSKKEYEKGKSDPFDDYIEKNKRSKNR